MKFLENLDSKRRLEIIEEIEDLENYPFFIKPHDLAKLKGIKNYYRIRIEDIRIIFRIDKENRNIYIEKISYRKRPMDDLNGTNLESIPRSFYF